MLLPASSIERELERQSYWFAQLGKIPGERVPGDSSPCGVMFRDYAFARLSLPPDGAWRVGQRNPAFTGSDLERQIFRGMFRAIERLLEFGKQEDDGIEEAYALKELRISSDTLRTLTNAVRCVGETHQLVEITVLKFWYDTSWPEPHLLVDESVLEEYSTRIPLRVRWTGGANQPSVEIMHHVLKLDISHADQLATDRQVRLQ